jgi:hypothetical protein
LCDQLPVTAASQVVLCLTHAGGTYHGYERRFNFFKL